MAVLLGSGKCEDGLGRPTARSPAFSPSRSLLAVKQEGRRSSAPPPSCCRVNIATESPHGRLSQLTRSEDHRLVRTSNSDAAIFLGERAFTSVSSAGPPSLARPLTMFLLRTPS